jgi:hypothetical protein
LNQQESPYSKKRAKKDDKPSKPCLCEDLHFWRQCPYIDTALRSSGFVEDPEKAKKVADFDAKDEKGILNKIREFGKRSDVSRSQRSHRTRMLITNPNLIR